MEAVLSPFKHEVYLGFYRFFVNGFRVQMGTFK